MARNSRNGGGYGYPNPFNETGPGADSPDVNGTGVYFNGWAEIDQYHLNASGPLDETPNSRSGGDIMGTPAPGEPRPDLRRGRSD